MEAKGLLIIKADHPLPVEHAKRIEEAAQPVCEALKLRCIVVENGVDAGVSYDLSPLISAMLAQTEAINNLAESNRLLIQAMAEADGMDPEPTQYLDGAPKT